MPRLNVQAKVRQALAQALPDIEVRVSVPDPRPKTLVVVRREGGRKLNRLIDRAGVGIFCWAPTELEVSELADKVSDALSSLDFRDGFALVEEEHMESDRDPLTKTPRWYASYTVTTYKHS
ncbi:MAG: hypothetical protein IJ125_05015 [Atopobiaceae bacterium]|nr:hypothetical protein [Atopobiaceae bacterium]